MRIHMRVTWVLLLMVSLAFAGSEGDPAHETPLSRRSIKVGLGSVDAVSGNLNLRVPLGPRLPGRIPLGFSYSFSNQDGLHSYFAGSSGTSFVGGSFRPVVWPSPDTFGDSPLQTTVMLDGQSLVFYRNHSSGKMPTTADFVKAMADRHVLPTPPQAAIDYDGGQLHLGGAIPSSDGTKFLLGFNYLASVEHYNKNTDTTTTTIVPIGGGYVVIDGPNAIWTQRTGTLAGHVVTHFTNLWSDHVTVDEVQTEVATGFYAVTSIQIQDMVAPANNLSLSFTPSGAPQTTTLSKTDVSGNLLYSYPNSLSMAGTIQVTNSLNLPSATLPGHFRAKQRFFPLAAPWCPGYSLTQTPLPEGIWDDGFLPSTITQTASDGSSQTVSILWTQYVEGFPLGNPTEINYPNGLKETFSYGHVTRLSQLSFSKCDGTWTGFTYARGSEDALEGLGQSLDNGVTQIIRQDTLRAGIADESFKILRTQPTWVPTQYLENGPTTWTCTEHESATAILHYPTSNPAGPYRALRLTHPSYVEGMDVAGPQGYLLATAAILFEEAFTGSGTPTAPSELGTSPYELTAYDGFDLKSWANPSGSLASGLPVNPVALRTTVHTRNLPTRITVAGNPNTPGARDDFGPVITDEYTDVPLAFPAVSGAAMPVWGLALPSSESHPIHRQGKISREADFYQDAPLNTLMRLLVRTDQKALDGYGLPALRFSAPNGGASAQIPSNGITSADFGTTTYSYDTLGRISQQQGDRDGFSAVEQRTYLDRLPLLKDTTKASLAGPGGPYHPNPDNAAVVVGKTYSWDNPHVQAGPSTVTDKTDGRTEFFSYHSQLGRLEAHTDVLGVVTTTSYDAWGRKAIVTRQGRGGVGSVSTTTTYDANGGWKDEVATADGKNLRTHTDLDAFGRVVMVTTYDANGAQATQQTFQYDGFGQKTAQSPVLLRTQSDWGQERWSYDDQGRLTGRVDAQGRALLRVVQQPAWSTINGMTAVWTTTLNDQGYTRSEGHDLLGQKVGVVDQAGQLSRYFYDQDGHLIQTLQGNQQRTYTYNAMGWMTSRTEPEEGTTTYSKFNLFGTPLISQQYGRGGSSPRNTFSTVLDAWLQPATVTATGPEGTVTRSFTYDHGTANTQLLTSLTETTAVSGLPTQSVTEAYGYDDLFRLSSKTISDGAQAFTVSRVLDAGGNTASLTYPAGGGRSAETVTVDYDDLRRPRTVKASNNLRGIMSYDDQISGTKVTSLLTYGNGVTTRQTQDKGELALTEHAVVNPNGLMARNPESNLVSWTPGGLMLSRGSDTFQYDGLQRLTQATVQGLGTGEQITQTFGYDAFGNRTANGYTYTPGAEQNASSRPPEVLAWTATFTNGNDLPATVSTLGGDLPTGAMYDALGRMTQVWAIPGRNEELATWIYDPSGRVVKETAGGVTSTFLLDAAGLRFKRMRADHFLQYTIYGFNQEPLVVLEQGPPIGTVQPLLATKISKSTKDKKIRPSILIVQPSGPITVAPGVEVAFAGESKFGRSFQWNFGDGATAGGFSANHAYTTPGSYLVTFTASVPGLKTTSTTTTITVMAPPSIAGFTASPSSVTLGQSSTLTWSASGTTHLSISGVGTVTGSSLSITPATTTTYTLTASNAVGSVTASTTVTVLPPTIVRFTASPSSIILGQSTTLSWNATGASSLNIAGVGAVDGDSLLVTPSATTVYTLTATNVSGTVTAAITVTVNNPPPPTINAFAAIATPINLGEITTLSWNTSGATSLSLDQGIGAVSGTSLAVSPERTTTYTLTATNAWGTATQSITVTVLPPVISSFTATPSGITLGQGNTLSWSTTYASSVSISEIGAVGTSGSQVVYPANTTTYILTATSSAGTSTAEVTVALAAPVIHSLTASDIAISSGGGTTLTWDVTGASSLSLSPSPGLVTGTSITVFPASTTTYTLAATNAAGTTIRSITITVDAAPVLLWKKSLIYGFGQLLCEENASGPALIYIQSDQVGSPNLITDGSGTVIGRTKNLPFGERFGATGAQSTRRFTNHEDQPGSAIYMQARMYLPAYGKFAQVDPAYDQTKDDPESWNLYNYVTNNPVTHTDPDGREAKQNENGSWTGTAGELQEKYNELNGFSESGAVQVTASATHPSDSGTITSAGGANGGGTSGAEAGTTLEAQRPSAQTNASTSGVFVSRSVTTTLSIIDGGSGDYNASYILTQSTVTTYWVPNSNEMVEHTNKTVLAHGDIRTIPDNPGNGSPTLNGTYTWVNHAHNGGFPTVQVRNTDASGALATTSLNPNTGSFRQTGINIHPPNPNSSRVWQDPGVSLGSASAREHPFSMGCWQPRPDANGRALIDGMRNARGSREIYLNTSWNEGRTFD
ncbi:MAG TPA: RHS repeat-associated core domain-containing protein [Geothrix sp.]|jgi:RHS repeat-associated protein